MSVDLALLLGRILFIAALYLFLAVLGILLWRELRARSVSAQDRAPADLLLMEPYDTGLEPGERIPLLAQTSIGRDGENDVVLDDSYLSASHARLLWNGKGWVLEDLNSTNGTRVNGRSIRGAVPVKPPDVIEFGRVKVKLVPA